VKQIPMVPPPKPVKRELSQYFRYLRVESGVYEAYRPVRRVVCDECVAYLHENGGQGPYPASARWTRKSALPAHQGTGVALRLCEPHKELWRAADGLS
jgi:hypothetical protein